MNLFALFNTDKLDLESVLRNERYFDSMNSSSQFQLKLSSQCRDFFNAEWQLYQKILNYNYMGHQKIYDVLRRLFADNWEDTIKVLDLGCGDASFLVHALSDVKVSHYYGLDISDTAISIAQENMKSIPCTTKIYSRRFL